MGGSTPGKKKDCGRENTNQEGVTVKIIRSGNRAVVGDEPFIGENGITWEQVWVECSCSEWECKYIKSSEKEAFECGVFTCSGCKRMAEQEQLKQMIIEKVKMVEQACEVKIKEVEQACEEKIKASEEKIRKQSEEKERRVQDQMSRMQEHLSRVQNQLIVLMDQMSKQPKPVHQPVPQQQGQVQPQLQQVQGMQPQQPEQLTQVPAQVPVQQPKPQPHITSSTQPTSATQQTSTIRIAGGFYAAPLKQPHVSDVSGGRAGSNRGLGGREGRRFFDGPNCWESNLSQYPVKVSTPDPEYVRVKFRTVEEAYQAFKLQRHGDREGFIQLAKGQKSSWEAMAMGKRCRSTTEWDDAKRDIMKTLIRSKCQDNKVIHDRLLATGEEIFIEDTPDAFWGRWTKGDNG